MHYHSPSLSAAYAALTQVLLALLEAEVSQHRGNMLKAIPAGRETDKELEIQSVVQPLIQPVSFLEDRAGGRTLPPWVCKALDGRAG